MVLLLAGPQKADRHDPSNMILSGHDSVFLDALGLSVFELMLS
jgi:hypothetical protein